MPRHIYQMASSNMKAKISTIETNILARFFLFLAVILISFSGFDSMAFAENSDQATSQPEPKKSKNLFSFLGLDKLLSKKTANEKPIILDNGLRELQKPTNFISFKGPKSGHLDSASSTADRRDTQLLNISLEEYYTQQFKRKINIGTELKAKPSLLFSLSPNRATGNSDHEEIGYSPYSSATKSQTAGSSIIFSLDREGAYLDPKSFRISLGSSFLVEPKSILPDYSSPFIYGRRAYNFTFGLGYEGFKVDASFSQEYDIFKLGLSGFDLGFGYYSDKWEASLSYAHYNQSVAYNDLSNAFLRNADPYGQIQAFEFGAIYQIFPHVSLSGKYRYYNYSNFPGFIADQHSFSFVTYFSF